MVFLIVLFFFCNSRLLLVDVVLVASAGFDLLYVAWAADDVDEIVFIGDGFVAFGAGFGSRLALFEVRCEGGGWDVEIAVLAIFWFFIALPLMWF